MGRNVGRGQPRTPLHLPPRTAGTAQRHVGHGDTAVVEQVSSQSTIHLLWRTHNLLGRYLATPLGPLTIVQTYGTLGDHLCESGWKLNGERELALRHLPQGTEVGVKVSKAYLATFSNPCKL